jgi:hypothetical protein
MTQFDDHMADKHQPMDHVIPEKLKRRIVRRRTRAMLVDFRKIIACNNIWNSEIPSSLICNIIYITSIITSI